MRLGNAIAAAAVCLPVAVSAVAAGQGNGTMTVSGASEGAIRYGAVDALGELRTRLTAGEAGAPCEVVALVKSGVGTCYLISGEISVSSNVVYDVIVSGASTSAGLRFMTEMPADFDACAHGERVSGVMFASSGAPGGWLLDQSRTAQRVHRFTVGLIVHQGDEPLAALAGASLTVSARPAD